MADKQDFYEVLGVQKGAGDDDIKKAYRKVAKECHPDLHPGDKEKELRFKQANEAYEVLSDPDKKARYDQFGHAGVDPNYGAGAGGAYGGGFGDFGDLGSIFESFFGGAFGGGASRRNTPLKGDNVRATLVLSFEEAAFGCEKDVDIVRIEACGDCHGSGAAPGTHAETCSVCGGSGQVRSTQRTPLGSFTTTGACTACGGDGKIVKTPCQKCRGTGAVRRRLSISVKVPAGIDDGQTISLRGQGSAGSLGGPSGDVLVTVTVRPHPLFVRDGTSVHCEFPVTFTQAALGSELEVPTLDGKVKYTMPEGTQTGTIFRIKGKGVPALNGKARGDHFVHMQVEVPKNLNKKQKELLQQFADACDEKNHPKGKGFFEKFRDK